MVEIMVIEWRDLNALYNEKPVIEKLHRGQNYAPILVLHSLSVSNRLSHARIMFTAN